MIGPDGRRVHTVPYDLDKHPFYGIERPMHRPERVSPHVQGAAVRAGYAIEAAGQIERCYSEWTP